jgi:hypothetical protein
METESALYIGYYLPLDRINALCETRRMTRRPKPNSPPRDMAAVVDLFTNHELAAALGVNYSTAAAMRWRGWIDCGYWLRLVDAARARDAILTAEMLLRFAHDRQLRLANRSHESMRPVQRAMHAATGPPPN